MEIMRQLKASGASIVFITHKLREVREVADRITVIRLGKVVGEASPTASNAELASMMVGRAVELTVHKDAAEDQRSGAGRAGPERRRRVRPHRRQRRQLRRPRRRDPRDRGGAGQRSDRAGGGAARAAAPRARLRQARRRGARRPERAPHPRRGRRIRPRGPHRGRPRRRLHDRREPHARPCQRRAVREGLERAARRPSTSSPTERFREFDVRAQSIDTPVRTLSGGNQQKVVLARELSRDSRSSSRRSRRAAWTSARSSSSTSASSRRATPACRSSSSPPNSTRSPRSPTGSW